MQITPSQLRTLGLHAGTAIGASIATATWMASHSVDIYAIINQLNVVVADVTKLVALVIPFATAAYGVFKATTRQKIIDVKADTDTVKGVIMQDTPKGVEIAKTVPGPVEVVGTIQAADLATKKL